MKELKEKEKGSKRNEERGNNWKQRGEMREVL